MENKVIKQILVLWIPAIVLIFSIYLLFTGKSGIVIGLALLGMALDGFVDYKLKGLHLEGDERYRLIILKGSDFAHRLTFSAIIILIVIHFLYKPLETSIVLLLLLVITYASSAASTLFLSYKN
ncbi:hypothetical protein [Bacillus sp. FSL K6-3431]|uniref:hypothetical protein n=1 Tax=Bacillus sp. FSL K6-3431 TaxID=2921500 RepID=UPI0030FB6909